MSADRLEQLRALLAEEPEDAFLQYAMALELRRLGRGSDALIALAQLAKSQPEHIATYYQLASLLADMGRPADAITACEAGMLRCTMAGDRKTRAELDTLRETLADSLD